MAGMIKFSIVLKRKHVIFWALIAISCIFRVASDTTLPIAYFLLAVCCFLGAQQVILAILFTWLFSMLNAGLGFAASDFVFGKYIVFVSASASMFFRSYFNRFKNFGVRISKPNFSILMLFAILMAHSILFSMFPVLSLLKLTLWGMVFCTLISAWTYMSLEEKDRLHDILLNILLLVLVISLFLVASPTGYLSNGSGFQGILNQPQVFGATAAIVSTLIFSVVIRRRNNLFAWFFFIFGIAMIFLSESRTAGVALILTIAISSIIFMFERRGSFFQTFRGLGSVYSVVVGVLGVVVILSSYSFISSYFENYISKGGRDGQFGGISESFEDSRGFLVLRMVNNISEYPFFGIGFGVGSDYDSFEMNVHRVFGLPISAPVEKGVLPIAIIEEFGLFLSAIIFLFMFLAIIRAANYGFYGISLIFLVYLLNIAEAMLFSPGGMGLLVLVFYSSMIVPREKVLPAEILK
ncbi:hypothetical protein C9974_00490 [Marinobacter sp. B9-2]|nr:hypothetical protein C9974_00490 [Marinobacter sp. B9-2]